MDDNEKKIKDLESQIDKLEKEHTQHAKAMDDEHKKNHEARKAILKAAMENMDEEKYASFKSAMEEDDETKKAMDEMEKEKEKSAKKSSKKGQEEEKKKDEKQEARIATLEAQIRDPLIAKMLKARESAGMNEESIKEYEKSLKAKSLEEVQTIYNFDLPIIEQLTASESEDTPEPKHFAFSARASGQMESISSIMEENN